MSSIPMPRLIARPWGSYACRVPIKALLKNPWTLLICKLVIGLVSAYDIFLTIKYVEFMPQMELNPIGRWLMMLDAGPECDLGQIGGFIAAKFAGNFLALCVIELVAAWKLRTAVIIAISVALLQTGLFYFLTFYHSEIVHDCLPK